MIIPADQYRAAARHSGHIDVRRQQADTIAKNLNGASLACSPVRASGFNFSRYQRGAGFGLDRNLAPLHSVGADAATRFKGHVTRCAQDDPAACVAHRLIGIHQTCVAQHRAVDAYLPAMRKYLAQVDGRIVTGSDFDTYARGA